MIRHVLLILATLLALQVSSTPIKNAKTGETIINPFSLWDQAEAELETLRHTVLSSIMAAENSFNIGYLGMVGYSGNILREAQFAIDQEHSSAVDKVNTIKNLAYSAKVDISVCTNEREQAIDQLSDDVKDQAHVCIVRKNEEAASILDESKYIVDITITTVNHYEYQLSLCESSSIFCIQPIITQIELASVQLRHNIQVEVNRANGLVETLRPRVQDCSDTNVADFADRVDGIVEKIATCADGIIG